MGDYNPHAPYILGQEWVPIRQANYKPDSIQERGYTLTLGAATAPVTGAYSVAEVPPTYTANTVMLTSVYPSGEEDLAGVVQAVTIPVDGVTVTGAVTAVVADFLHPNDQDSAEIFGPTFGEGIGLSFDVGGFARELLGKRILKVELLYTANGAPEDLARVAVNMGRAVSSDPGGSIFPYQEGIEGPPLAVSNGVINTISFSELNPFWSPTFSPAPGAVNTSLEVFPWRYEELSLLDASATPLSAKLQVTFYWADPVATATSTILINYAALRITYCEENRVLYGGRRNTDRPGANLHRLLSPSFTIGDLLPAGEYVVTTVFISMSPKPTGVLQQGTDTHFPPTLHAVRQLYELPLLRGVAVDRNPGVTQSPLSSIGETFIVAGETNQLTTIDLYTSSGIVTGSHAYAEQLAAPVYGPITALQWIRSAAGTNTTVEQVRFYARRFGNTTAPLVLTSPSATTASITPAAFDLLPKIVDNWREVTLDIAPTVVVGGAVPQNWEWTAAGETLPGNRWEVLGVRASPAAAGTYDSRSATYLAPDLTSTFFSWKSPNVTGNAVADVWGDATLILSADAPAVSGFALTIEEQAVETALECNQLSGCVPSKISYVNLTWSAQTFLPVSGFGQYELERFDDITGDWQLIMSATSPLVTGFADYEARVGVLSTYRVRTCNVLDFCGPWVTGTATVPSPGVTIGGDGNSILIFTSNENPSSNLAYTMAWEGVPIETFVFPEAGEVQLQRMFNRDFAVAFHPLERGGDQFTRSIVVNAAAIPAPSLANFRGLRDLAWAQLNYVCVRDELGNRWFANIIVPDGIVRNDRTIYVAQIRVAEVTDTPTPVDPAGTT